MNIFGCGAGVALSEFAGKVGWRKRGLSAPVHSKHARRADARRSFWIWPDRPFFCRSSSVFLGVSPSHTANWTDPVEPAPRP